ncbi:hypothetical protein STCU_00350 [Strigomonas culicis]|uniref:Uncharacterized protein n=1 Tax=Strigomonas culicis TaxID=28005 RepID=S9WCP0_9TRYP|nr:hypothetical protein STCU_00350 [Strigomonas culicis]|eukprot:EPY36901.1 hypothetical protein STCU_00350 [Strigomonas culicis]
MPNHLCTHYRPIYILSFLFLPPLSLLPLEVLCSLHIRAHLLLSPFLLPLSLLPPCCAACGAEDAVVSECLPRVFLRDLFLLCRRAGQVDPRGGGPLPPLADLAAGGGHHLRPQGGAQARRLQLRAVHVRGGREGVRRRPLPQRRHLQGGDADEPHPAGRGHAGGGLLRPGEPVGERHQAAGGPWRGVHLLHRHLPLRLHCVPQRAVRDDPAQHVLPLLGLESAGDQHKRAAAGPHARETEDEVR